MKNKKNKLFPILSFFIGLSASLLFLEVAFRILPTSQQPHRLPVNESNPIVRIQENIDFIWSTGWNFSIISRKRSNNYGFLNDADYAEKSLSPLMVIIGDSYVEALQVDNDKTMHGILAQKINKIGRVYSYGSSGAQLPTYLAYADYVKDKFKPDSMVFVIIRNDFDESLLKYNKSPGKHYFYSPGNPHSSTEIKRIDYHLSPVKNILRHSYIFRYIFLNLNWNWRRIEAKLFRPANRQKYVGHTLAKTAGNRITDSKWAVDSFFRLLPIRSGLKPSKILFIVDGMRPHLYSDSDLSKAEKSYFSIMRDYFMELASKRGYEVIDMQTVFISLHRKYGSHFEFETDGHWNQMGHKIVANQIEKSSVFKKTFEY